MKSTHSSFRTSGQFAQKKGVCGEGGSTWCGWGHFSRGSPGGPAPRQGTETADCVDRNHTLSVLTAPGQPRTVASSSKLCLVRFLPSSVSRRLISCSGASFFLQTNSFDTSFSSEREHAFCYMFPGVKNQNWNHLEGIKKNLYWSIFDLYYFRCTAKWFSYKYFWDSFPI